MRLERWRALILLGRGRLSGDGRLDGVDRVDGCGDRGGTGRPGSGRGCVGRLVSGLTVRRLHRGVLQDLVKSFERSCEGNERRAESGRGGFARGHLLLASKRVGQVKQAGHGVNAR
jgi:hypothetical protein